MAYFRKLDDLVISHGERLFQIRCVSGIADDDGRYDFKFWITSPTETDARTQAQTRLDDAHEGGEILYIDEETLSDAWWCKGCDYGPMYENDNVCPKCSKPWE